MNVVISQPMFFPWIGMFEQIRLADVYVHYSDVQFSKGSFVNRVQVKTAGGSRWLTVPLEGLSISQAISEVRISYRKDWRDSHLSLLRQAYRDAPYRDEMMKLVEAVYGEAHETIDGLSKASLAAVCAYYGFDRGRRFIDIETLGIGGSSSRRVLDIVLHLGGDVYVTGQGASRYLDHALFEDAGVRVEYMDYRKLPYPQQHGGFTPYVSVLDLIANTGRDGAGYVSPRTVYWRDYLSHE